MSPISCCIGLNHCDLSSFAVAVAFVFQTIFSKEGLGLFDRITKGSLGESKYLSEDYPMVLILNLEKG